MAGELKGVIDEMTTKIDFNLVNLVDRKVRNTCMKIYTAAMTSCETDRISTLFCTVPQQPERNHQAIWQLSYSTWHLGIIAQSHLYKKIISSGRQNAMKVRIGFKRQVIGILGFHSLFDWCYLTMWLV